MMSHVDKSQELFHRYYLDWIDVYKRGAVRDVTLKKYLTSHSWVVKLMPEVRLCDLNRVTYQKLINDYAKQHEKQTTLDFHHQLKGAILDALDEGYLLKNPTRKIVIKGRKPGSKKPKFLNQFELQLLLNHLDLGSEVNWDWLIFLIAKTGLRFSEALAITPADFDFSRQLLVVNKTWDYKTGQGFLPTKTASSVRKLQLDWQTIIRFEELIRHLPEESPIFAGRAVYNSTVNAHLEKHCRSLCIPLISLHGLRHTHASVLLFAGVSIASVSRRLGHSNMTTTQKVYLHIIQELENQDMDLMMRSLSRL